MAAVLGIAMAVEGKVDSGVVNNDGKEGKTGRAGPRRDAERRAMMEPWTSSPRGRVSSLFQKGSRRSLQSLRSPAQWHTARTGSGKIRRLLPACWTRLPAGRVTKYCYAGELILNWLVSLCCVRNHASLFVCITGLLCGDVESLSLSRQRPTQEKAMQCRRFLVYFFGPCRLSNERGAVLVGDAGVGGEDVVT